MLFYGTRTTFRGRVRQGPGEDLEMDEILADAPPGITVSPYSAPRLVSLIKNAKKNTWIQNREFGIIFNTPVSVEKLLKTVQDNFNHELAMPWKDSLECPKAYKPKSAKPLVAP